MYSNSLLEHILSLPGNDKCLECSGAEPKWASFPTGIFLCFKCARAHKKFAKPQTVKSLEVADFSKHEISLLSLGGNFRFLSLMNEYSVSLTEPNQEHKYQTIIASYYCTLLEAEVNKLEKVPGADKKCQDLLAQRPIYEVGGELNVDGKFTFGSTEEESNSSIPKEEKKEDQEKIPEVSNNSQEQSNSGWGIGNFFGFVNNALHKTAQYAGIDEQFTNMQNKVNEKLEYYGVNQFVRKSSEKVKDAAVTAKDYIKDKSTDLYQNNEMVHNAIDKIGNTASVVKEKTVKLAKDTYQAASTYVNTNFNPQGQSQASNQENSSSSQEQNNEVPPQEHKNISEQLKDDQI